MNPVLLLLILLFLLALPTWPYSGAWGYYPSVGVGILFILVFLQALTRPPRR